MKRLRVHSKFNLVVGLINLTSFIWASFIWSISGYSDDLLKHPMLIGAGLAIIFTIAIIDIWIAFKPDEEDELKGIQLSIKRQEGANK